MFVQVEDFDNLPYALNIKAVNSFQEFIDNAEKKALIDMLGYEFYKELDAKRQEDPIVEPWTLVIKGTEYEYDSRLKKWDGLSSMLKPLIYCLYIREYAYPLNGLVRTSQKNENSELVNQGRFLAEAYNDYSDQARKLYEYLKENEDLFPDIYFTQPKRANAFGL